MVYGFLDPESLPLETLPPLAMMDGPVGGALAVDNEGNWQTVAR